MGRKPQLTQSLSGTEVKSRAVVGLEERLSAHLQLLSRIEALLNVVENSAGDLEQADLAEQRVIEEISQIGQQALSSWAERHYLSYPAIMKATL